MVNNELLNVLQDIKSVLTTIKHEYVVSENIIDESIDNVSKGEGRLCVFELVRKAQSSANHLSDCLFNVKLKLAEILSGKYSRYSKE